MLSLIIKKRVTNKMFRKWWLFHATDFQTLMHPCFIVCRIFGVFPYKINNSIFEISKPHFIKSVIIFGVLCVLELTCNITIFVKNDFVAFILSVERTVAYILTDALVITTLVSTSSRMRLLQTIMKISSRLSPESYQKLSRLIHAKDIFGPFYVISLMLIYLHKLRADILSITCLTYVALMIFQLDMLYVNCVSVIKACFKEINSNLLHMQKLMVNSGSCVVPVLYCEQKNPFLIIKIKDLKKQHIMISITVQMLNKSFSLQLLVSILTALLGSTIELYYNIVDWHNGLVINLDQVWLLGVIYYFTKLLSIVWACETCKNQANEIRTTIHDVLNSTRDKKIKNELHLFSLQLLHFDNTFSAKAVRIDTKSLATTVGTIATYILILLQFLITSHSCDGKTAMRITQSN